jgi:hypothetical protein
MFASAKVQVSSIVSTIFNIVVMSKMMTSRWIVTRFYILALVINCHLGWALYSSKAPCSSIDAKIDERFRTRGNHIKKQILQVTT